MVLNHLLFMKMLKMFLITKTFPPKASWPLTADVVTLQVPRCESLGSIPRPFIKTTLHLQGVQKALGDITVATPTSGQLIGRSTGVVSFFLFLVSSST